MGKEYSGQTLINRLEDYKTGEKEKVELGSEIRSEAIYERNPDGNIGIPSLVLDLMKSEKLYPETTQPFKTRRKKRKGQRL